MDERFDDIVVGAGSAGCVLAARLSEDPRRRVLLLEAGPDHPDEARLPAALRDAGAAVFDAYNWPYSARTRSDAGLLAAAHTARALAASPGDAWTAARAAAASPKAAIAAADSQPYPVGRVVGGSSAINGALALRPSREDMACWAEVAGPAWSWDALLPLLRALESDADFDGPLHGRDGPLPIERPDRAALSPFHAAFVSACRESALGDQPDLNAGNQPGVGVLPFNVRGSRRISSAQAFLAPVRARPNLAIRADRLAHRVFIEGTRVTGVELSHHGRVERVAADRVTLCAGAINTPALLLRSGIGDAAHCTALGLRPVADLPGVGAGLQDHPSVILWLPPQPGGVPERPILHQAMARLPSAGGDGPPDIHLYSIEGHDTTAQPLLATMLGCTRAHGLAVTLARPHSRGRVTLRSADPLAAPLIELGLCSAAGDTDRLMHGVRAAWALLRSPAFAPLVRPPYYWREAIVGSDELLRRAVTRLASACWHAAGTARMGAASDRGAVVDGQGRVHGLSGLRVADASIMPTIPSAPTHLSCLVIAERIAQWMR